MTSQVHAINRTSPKGGPFLGTCMQCGQTDLPITAVGKPCENPANLSQEEALVLAMEEVGSEVAPRGLAMDVKRERAAFETWWRMKCIDRDMPSSAPYVFDAWLARARATEPLRAALEQISRLRPAGDVERCSAPRKLVEQMETIALGALASAPPFAAMSGEVEKAREHVLSGDYRMAYFAMCEAYGKIAATLTPPTLSDAASQLATKLTGRARFLRDRGEIKSPELMEEAASALTHAWTGDGNRCSEDGYDGGICGRCGRPDLLDTEAECDG